MYSIQGIATDWKSREDGVAPPSGAASSSDRPTQPQQPTPQAACQGSPVAKARAPTLAETNSLEMLVEASTPQPLQGASLESKKEETVSDTDLEEVTTRIEAASLKLSEEEMSEI